MRMPSMRIAEASPTPMSLRINSVLKAKAQNTDTMISAAAVNAEIAEVLTLERTTIKSHVQRILAKLGARNRVEVVIAAYAWGLITPGRTPPFTV